MIGIILAGGQSRRMGGGDKGTRRVGGRSILDRVAAAMRPQCEHLVISANGDPERFASLGLPVAEDSVPDYPGPLAGVLAGLDHVAHHHPGAAFAVTVPTDTPFLPHDLIARLEDGRVADRAAIVCAHSGDAKHHVAALWSVALRAALRRALVEEGSRKVGAFITRHPVAYVTWPVEPYDPFLNVNTPEDLAVAERIAASLQA